MRSYARRLRFTREGRWFTFLTVGVGFGAINTGNNLLYLLLGWMLSAIIAWISWKSASGLPNCLRSTA